MFDDREDFNEPQLRAIRALGDMDGGRLLADYVESEMEGYINAMLHSPADDTASMAHGQAGAAFGKRIRSLLTDDIRTILEQHNVEVQDE